ncbi:MAG: hypothetical protein R3B57_09935 [Phycisphaerales bacterium]
MRWHGSRMVGVALVSILAGGAPLLGGCQAKKVITQSNELTGLKADGNDAYARGDYRKALEAYGSYVDQRPQSAWGRYRLGLTYMALNEPRYAREQFAIAHDLEPENGEYGEALADALLAIGDVAALFEHLDRMAAADRTSAGYLRTAKYAEKLGFMDEALAAYRKGVALDGDRSPEPHRALADFYRRIGDRKGEVRELRKVLWFDAQDPTASARLEELGEIVGPSFALEPDAEG